MTEQQYDFVVIGGGSAGYAAASQAVALGLKTAVIEGGEEVGGLCILRGCMPSKTFLESGHRAHAIRRAGEFGLRAEYGGADGAAILRRKRELVADFAGYRREQLESGRFAYWRGMAHFTGPEMVRVELRDGEPIEIRGRAFLVATGSRIKWLPVSGLKEAGCLTSDDVLESERVPESVVILGAGPTGVEFASYYAGLGTKVSIVQRGQQLLKGADSDVAEALTEGLRHRGVEVYTGTELRHVERGHGRKRVCFHDGLAEIVIEAEEIVYSLGREPNVAPLEPQKAGVHVREWGGLHVNAHQQTGVPHIFAAGDVCGPYEVVHIAIQQGELAARNAAKLIGGEKGPLEEMDYALKLFAIFSHPEVAWVGLTAREASEQLALNFVQAQYPFAEHGKAMVHGETEGFVKLLAAGPDRRIVGGAVVGAQASELIHEVAVAMRFGATAAQFASIPHYHPTLSEIWTYPAEALAMMEE